MSAWLRRWPLALVLGASIAAWALGLGACAVCDWHAPPIWAIVALVAVSVGLGVASGRSRATILSERDRASLGPERLARTRAAGAKTTAAATGIAAALAAVGSVIAYFAIGPMSRVPGSFVAAAWLATIPPMYSIAFALLAPRVIVGVDAVRVGRRTIRLRDVRGVWAAGKDLCLGLEGGRTETVGAVSEALAGALAEALAPRVAGARDGTARFARAGRALAAWRKDLVAPGYREGAATADEAERAIGAAAASVDERVGAAIVLAHAGLRDRVRVAAGACAEPGVRALLERAAADALDEDDLARLETRDVR